MILEISRKNNWAAVVHSKLISMLVNMLYQVSSESHLSKCLLEQVELIGGIDFIFVEYSGANTREDRENLYVAVFDYLLCEINAFQLDNEAREFDEGEIKVLACLLSLVEAPEIIHVFVKLGLEGVGKILQRSISFSLARHPNGVRLNMLLELFVLKLELVVQEFSHVGKEFAPLVHVTETCRCFKDVVGLKAESGKLAWSTLHCLVNSEMISCRHTAQIWLVDLLVEEVFNTGRSTQDNITTLKQQIYTVGIQGSVGASDTYLSVWLFCGLLKSKDHIIRQGFLFVLEKLLIRCKLRLDGDKFKIISGEDGDQSDCSTLDKANAIIDIMSCALSLLAQVNETHHLIILKMCDVLFSQVCVQNPQRSVVSPDVTENAGSVHSAGAAPDHSASSMAVLLLQGQAIVPVQLVSRMPATLFYWPLIQLASAATDNISLGVAVGSQGRGNVPGATSDIRAALLLLLIGKCGADPTAYQEVEGEGFFRELLDDTDSRVAYYSSAFLLKQMMAEEPEKYKRVLQSLVFRAQQSNNEKLLENPYLQMRGILQLSNDMIRRKAS